MLQNVKNNYGNIWWNMFRLAKLRHILYRNYICRRAIASSQTNLYFETWQCYMLIGSWICLCLERYRWLPIAIKPVTARHRVMSRSVTSLMLSTSRRVMQDVLASTRWTDPRYEIYTFMVHILVYLLLYILANLFRFNFSKYWTKRILSTVTYNIWTFLGKQDLIIFIF